MLSASTRLANKPPLLCRTRRGPKTRTKGLARMATFTETAMNYPSDTPLIASAARFEQPANYPRNLWWFAARSDEVGPDKPLGLWLLDEPVVLYRKSDGAVVALDNRCPHRWAPLSE